MTPKVRQHYQRKLRDLEQFVRVNRVLFNTDEEVDDALAKLVNEKYLEGEGSHTGDYTLAALIDRIPEFALLGTGRIPRAWRCLRGWRTSQAEEDGVGEAYQPHHGLLVPGDKLDRDQRHLEDGNEGRLHPSGFEWLVFSRGPKMDKVWTFDYSEYLSVFRSCCQELRLNLVPCQGRHSGPSTDIAMNTRTQEEVQKRGGWVSRQSTARYEKSGRLAATWRKMDQQTQLCCALAERHLEGNYVADFFSGHMEG